MRINKIKYKPDQLEIHYEETAGKNTKEIVFRSSEKPHPDFDLSLARLIPDVYDILQLDRAWRIGAMSIRGISWSQHEDTGIEGAVITALVPLETANGPLVINTPHLPFEQYSESGESPTMDEKAKNHMEDVRTEAEAYVGGKRAQLELAL